MNFKSTLTTVLFGVALLSSAAVAKDNSKMFLKKSAQNVSFEVKQAELALQMAKNPDIQAFAKMIVEDHAGTNARITALAKDKNVTLAAEITPKQKSLLKRLSKLNDRNRAFDREYLEQAIADHKTAIKAFEKQKDHGTDADVRAFAVEALPTQKKHLEEAASLRMRLNLKNESN